MDYTVLHLIRVYLKSKLKSQSRNSFGNNFGWSKWSKEMVEMILLARNIGANHQKNKRVKLDIMKAQNFINIIVLMY